MAQQQDDKSKTNRDKKGGIIDKGSAGHDKPADVAEQKEEAQNTEERKRT